MAAGPDQSDAIDLEMGKGFRLAEDHLAHLQLGRSFLSGPHLDDEIIRLKWWVRESDGRVIGRVWWGPGAQGPPGHAHGGSIAAVLDEALGSACWVAGHAVVAAELNTSFRNMLPLGTVYTAEAWVDDRDGRKVRPCGRIIGDDGTIYAEACGLFIELGDLAFEQLADKLQTSALRDGT